MIKYPLLSNIQSGGPVLGMTTSKTQIFYNHEDTHTLIIGATRCGKTRCLVLPSVGLTGMSGESMVLVDPKGELYAYTHPFLEGRGYECITLDFTDPARSSCYNFLQPCIDAVNAQDVPRAVSAARDIAAILVPEDRAERVWTDGARSVLTMGILAVVVDNAWRPELQNLANVQQFITHMCRPIGKQSKIALTAYIDGLPTDHPVRFAEGISNIAPEKMRGSFYTQALVSLDLFTDPNIHTMTAATDFDIEATGQRKRAIFIILPDQKKTYHALAALFVNQHYQTLVEVANRRGGRLERRVEFFCDEFGNFVKIPDFDTVLTVSGGRGIRFHIVLQDLNQLDEKYGDKVGRTIRSNCETWVYLQTDNEDTKKELTAKCGRYTIKSPSLSGSTGGHSSASYNLTGRDLLMPDEIAKIKRPYQLVTSRADPAVLYAPDLSQTVFQNLFGMGDKEHDRLLRLARLKKRTQRPPKVHYWGIWDQYVEALLLEEEQQRYE